MYTGLRPTRLPPLCQDPATAGGAPDQVSPPHRSTLRFYAHTTWTWLAIWQERRTGPLTNIRVELQVTATSPFEDDTVLHAQYDEPRGTDTKEEGRKAVNRNGAL